MTSLKYIPVAFVIGLKKKKEKQKTVKTFAVVICLFHFMGNKVYFSVPISKACTC